MVGDSCVYSASGLTTYRCGISCFFTLKAHKPSELSTEDLTEVFILLLVLNEDLDSLTSYCYHNW